MSGTGNACRLARLTKPIAEMLFRHWLAAVPDDERKVACRTGLDRSRQWCKDGRLNYDAVLLGRDLEHARLDVLAPKPNRVAPAQTRVEQQIEGEALARSDRPSGLELRNLVIGPNVEAIGLDVQ